MTVRILVGDVRDRLVDLPDDSVHCVVTSPPYFGLRDYGTAQWDGGDPACDHVQTFNPHRDTSGGLKCTDGRPNPKDFGTRGEQASSGRGAIQYRAVCGKCGATRIDNQIGLEPTLADYLATMVAVFREVRRVLRPDGTCWLNIGDSYNANGRIGHGTRIGYKQGTNRASANGADHTRSSDDGLKEKDLMMVPARLAIALCDDGWYLRSDIIWHKRAPMPESVTDRPTSAHEHIFLLTKQSRYFYDADAVREPHEDVNRPNGWHGNDGISRDDYKPKEKDGLARSSFATPKREYHPMGRNSRNVWTLSPEPFTGWGQTSRQVRVEPDAADDDTMRTPSADCPVHAWTGRSDPIRVGDERADGGSIRTSGNGARLAQSPLIGSGSIDQHHAPDSPAGSSDSPLLSCSPSATLHSNGTSKTGHALSTTQPCTVSGEMSYRTGDIPASHVSPGLDDSGIPGSSETLDDTSHSDTCTCSYHKTVTESISHFATFPTEIPRRAIKAGTSEKGCCATCGAPWVRTTETDYRKHRPSGGRQSRIERGNKVHDGGFGSWGTFGTNLRKEVTTTGWQPSCACGAETVPCRVLDPFGGSGTTALVADELGRDCTLIELNPEYAEMSRQRIYGAAPMFAAVEVA